MNRRWKWVAAANAAFVGALAAFILEVCPLPARANMYTNDTDWGGADWTLANGPGDTVLFKRGG